MLNSNERHAAQRIQDTRRAVLRLNAVLNQNPGILDRRDFRGGIRLNAVLGQRSFDGRDFLGH